MLTIGGVPSGSVNPVNSHSIADTVNVVSSGCNLSINEKPHLGKFFRIPAFPVASVSGKKHISVVLGMQLPKLRLAGRFLQTDPMGYKDSLNLYQAFNNNPVNFTDPMGQSHIYPSIPGTSYGESQLYHSDPYFRSYVDSFQRGVGSRVIGGVQAVGGAVMMKIGATITAGSGGALSFIGGYIIAKGFDNLQAGARRLVSGEEISTYEHHAVKGASSLVTNDPRTQEKIANYWIFATDLFSMGIAYNEMTKPGQLLPQNYVEVPKDTLNKRITTTTDNGGVPDSLLKGKSNTYTYLGIRDENPVYTGITNNPVKRAAQHGDRFELDIISNNPLTRRQARAIEQVIIEKNPQFENLINSIGKYRNWYSEAVGWGEKWLIDNGFEWLLKNN